MEGLGSGALRISESSCFAGTNTTSEVRSTAALVALCVSEEDWVEVSCTSLTNQTQPNGQRSRVLPIRVVGRGRSAHRQLFVTELSTVKLVLRIQHLP